MTMFRTSLYVALIVSASALSPANAQTPQAKASGRRSARDRSGFRAGSGHVIGD